MQSQKPNTKYKLIILLLLATNVASLVYAFRQPAAEIVPAEYKIDYPLIDPARAHYDLNNLVTNVQPLREYLKSLPEQNKDWAEMSIYFEVLNTGSNITVNPDLKIFPASLAKLPIAMATMKKVEKGEWNLQNTKFALEIGDVDTHAAPELIGQAGVEYNVEFLLSQMLLESDNTAFSMLTRNLHLDEIVAIGEAVGLDKTFILDENLSAKEYTRLYRILYLATYINETNSQYLLNLLKESSFSEFMKSGLPKDVPFAHKWGSNIERNVFGDSGIVYIEGRPYMISVLIHGKNSDAIETRQKASQLMKEIAQKSYEYIVNYKKQ